MSNPFQIKKLSPSLESLLNQQLKYEMIASHFYKMCYAFYSKPQLELTGLKNYFLKAYQEEDEHTRTVIDYINLREGKVIIPSIDSPSFKIEEGSYSGAIECFKRVLEIEEGLTAFILNIHKTADDEGDTHLSSYLEDTFIPEQYKAVSEIQGLYCKLNRMGPGLGFQLFNDSLK